MPLTGRHVSGLSPRGDSDVRGIEPRTHSRTGRPQSRPALGPKGGTTAATSGSAGWNVDVADVSHRLDHLRSTLRCRRKLKLQDEGGGACFCLQLPVSDEAEIAELIGEMLGSAGYKGTTAESGAVALAMLAEARFDAIVSDLHMPDIDGAQLWREVRASQPALARRMLFVTGDTLSPIARQFLDEARCDSLKKPFSKQELLGRVTGLLSR